jgi:sulfite reductase beta subunit-like hemoprotein
MFISNNSFVHYASYSHKVFRQFESIFVTQSICTSLGRKLNKKMRLKYVTEAHGVSKLRAEITPMSGP